MLYKNYKKINEEKKNTSQMIDKNSNSFNEKDEEGNAVVHSLQEMYDRAFVLSGKREPDLTGGFSTYLKYKNITFYFFNIPYLFPFSVNTVLKSS